MPRGKRGGGKGKGGGNKKGAAAKKPQGSQKKAKDTATPTPSPSRQRTTKPTPSPTRKSRRIQELGEKPSIPPAPDLEEQKPLSQAIQEGKEEVPSPEVAEKDESDQKESPNNKEADRLKGFSLVTTVTIAATPSSPYNKHK